MDALRHKRPLPKTPRLTEAAIVAACLIVFDLALARLFPLASTNADDALWRLSVVRAIESALILIYWRLRVGGLSTLGLDDAGILRGLKTAVAGSLLLGALAGCLEAFFAVFYSKSFLGALAAQGREPTIALVAAGVVLGPLFEELLFRALLYGSLRRRAGVTLSTLLVTAAFAGAHLPSSQVSLIQVVGGVFFALSLEYSGSILAPFLIHLCGNAAIFLMPLIFA